MLRTAKRCAGNFSRATMAPHPQQQQQQQPSSQHASGSAAPQQRSTSVLASLLRMRSQFMRLRGTQQQQVISVVLARSSKYRLLGSRDPLLTAAASGEEAEGEAGQNGGARGDSSVGSSVLQEGVLLCTEAQRLLRSESRGNDPLSDVALSSPLYPVEAGRLLATAAMFGAATTYPRVQEVCAWLRFNADTLNTTRQVMSLCTPLLNLTDGATAGMAFVLEVLYEPLLSVLHDVGRDGGGAAASTSAVGTTAAPSSSALGGGSIGGSGGGGVTTEQQLVALTSCFAMVTKWSTAFVAQTSKAAAADATDTAATAASSADAVDAPHEGDRAKMLRITEATVAALMRLTKDCAEEDSRTHNAMYATLPHIAVGDAVQWLQCLHGLESAFATTMAAREERENALRRLVLCHRVLLPLVQQALERDCGAAAAAFSEEAATTNSTSSPSAAGTTAAGSSTSGPSSSSVLWVQDVANLVQIGLFPSVEASHTEVALRCGLRALAGTLAAASVRELCFMTQVVGKVRMHQPRALTAPLLRSLVAALRPRLFSLYGANAYQLRAQDCSLLLSQLSRWEDVAGVTLSDDVVQLLCQRFSEQLSTAQAAQLVPFLQGLARLEERHRRMDVAPSAAAGKAVEVREKESADSADTDATTESARLRIRRRRKKRAVRYHYSTTARVAQQCAQRTAALASGSGQAKEEASAASATPADRKSGGIEAPRLSAVEAAQLISSLVQLSSPLVDDVFAAVEPLLAADLALTPTAAAAAAAGVESTSALSPFPAPAVDLSARVAVQEALIRFLAFANTRRAGRSSPPHGQREFPIAPDGAEGTVKRASVLLAEMEHSLTTVVQQATRPRDVVAVWPLVRHRLLTQRAVKAEEEMEEDVVSPPSPSSSLPSHASSAKRSRAEVRLAMCFAQRVCAVAPECNDAAMGSLAVAITSLTTSGTLPIAAAHQAVEALLMRCVAGLEAASAEVEVAGSAVEGDGAASATPVRSASPLTLNLDTCKKVMDAARSTMAAVPPAQRRAAGPPLIFLRHVASLCTSLAEAMTVQDGSTADDAGDVPRGTQHAYTAAKKDVRRHTMLGRTIVSFCAGFLSPSAPNAAEGDGGDVSAVGQLQYEAWCSAVAAYLDVVRSAMRRYATEASFSESWCGAAADGSVATPLVPLDLLSMTARVVTQLQRLLHRSDGAAAAQRIEVDVEVGEEPSSAEGGAEEFSSVTNATVRVEGDEGREDVTAGGTLTAVDAAVAEVLGSVGDTIALLAKQERQARVDVEPAGSGEVDAAAGDGADADNDDAPLSSSHSVGTSAQAAVSPKDILMLLQSFEMAKYRHTEMLYGILPELRSCAAELNPLQLSLLIHALAQLGAWNSRLLRVLAAAVEAKVRACELRQCHNLLRDLCRSGSVSPNTFVELRGTAYADWTRGGPQRQQQQKGVTTQEPLQRLAEAVLCRLDALIRTRDAFLYVAVTAAVGDLIGVVAALRFFEVPPPPTFDAFVVLAIHKLAALHKKLPASTAVQHALVLLDAASRLRQPAQQRVSVRTLWVIVQRVVASASSGTGAAAGSSVDRVLSWRVCGQLWQLACQHTLRYGKTTKAALFEASQPDKATLLSLLRGRFGGAVEAYAWGPNPPKDAPPSSLAPPRSLPAAAAVGPAKALPILSFPAEQIALRRYGARATPSLVRADRELDDCLCYPLRLARRIVETQDVSVLVASSPLTAPLRQARQCVRLAACLLRADVWESESIAVETQLLLVAALQRLWDAADVQGLLCAAPESFSTEELVVLTALAGHLLQAGTAADIAEGDARRYREACASALRQLSAKATQWRLAAAVDAWMLHVRLAAPPASPQLRLSELEAVEGMHATLARSGEVVLAAFLQLQPSSSSSSSVARTRLNAELMRFFQTSGSSCLSSFAAGSSSAIPTFSTESDHSSTQSDEMHFREQYAEVQRCIVTALAASSAH